MIEALYVILIPAVLIYMIWSLKMKDEERDI